MMEFETVIGLEVHLQLNTNTKIFCGCQNVFGSLPNSHVCPVCLGLPGSLPVLNRTVLDHAMRIGLALNGEINTYVKFDRKNYYYPDLPKGYQISQYDFPIAKNGFLMIKTLHGEKRIGITRAHMEEDAGKLIHDDDLNATLVDYNRTGTPLVEIVSEPDMRNPQEAYDYLTALKLVLSYLGVSDCDMEKGSLRCDANVSIRPQGQEKFGTKTELKNMNSFSAVKRGLEYEVDRQTRVILSGGKIIQETLLWNEAKGVTVPMRSKEQAHDYRYFPEPDLVPFTLEQEVIAHAKQALPELPYQKRDRLMNTYKISEYDATIIVQDRFFADFFEATARLYPDIKKVCNWMNVQITAELNNRKCSITDLKLTPRHVADLIGKVEEGVVSNVVAKEILNDVITSGKDVSSVIEDKGLAQNTDDATLEAVIDVLIAEHPAVVEQIKNGKPSAAGFFVGQAIKKMQGKANPKKVTEILNRRFKNV